MLAFVVAMVIYLIVYGWESWRAPAAWKRFRKSLGLRDDPTATDRSVGTYEGRSLRAWVDVELVGGDDGDGREIPFTILEVDAAVPDDFYVYFRRRGLLSVFFRVRRGGGYKQLAYGMEPELELGRPRLDKRFEILGSAGDELREALTHPRAQSHLEELVSYRRELHIETGAIRLEWRGRPANGDKLIKSASNLVGLAQLLDDSSEVVLEVEQSEVAQEEVARW